VRNGDIKISGELCEERFSIRDHGQEILENLFLKVSVGVRIVSKEALKVTFAALVFNMMFVSLLQSIDDLVVQGA